MRWADAGKITVLRVATQQDMPHFRMPAALYRIVANHRAAANAANQPDGLPTVFESSVAMGLTALATALLAPWLAPWLLQWLR